MITAKVLFKSDWEKIAEKAHLVTFNEVRPAEFDRVDFAVISEKDGELGGYLTCKEMDAETVYIQFGGVFPNFAKSIYVIQGYAKMIDACKARFKYLRTRIENTNAAMLKLAMSVGFLIVGISNLKDKVYLELALEVV